MNEHKSVTVGENLGELCHETVLPILVRPEGTGTLGTADDQGWPVVIEWDGDTPKVLVWADINQEDPTHEIDLSGALVTNRKEVIKSSDGIVLQDRGLFFGVVGTTIGSGRQTEDAAWQDVWRMRQPMCVNCQGRGSVETMPGEPDRYRECTSCGGSGRC